jgi:hypothetical protein
VFDGTTEAASHEIVEAATDPAPLFGWFDWSTLQEAGDLCEAAPLWFVGMLSNGSYEVSPYWSNADGRCVVPGDGGPRQGGFVDGTFVRLRDNGQVYRIAGGAPIYVSSWSVFGGPQLTIPVSATDLAALPAMPADGTFIRGAQTGEVFRIAGGAPVYVSTWSAFGAAQPTIAVDQAAIDNAGRGDVWRHLNAVPMDGTLISATQTGEVFRIAGGAPIYVSNWASIGGPQPTVGVDTWSVDNAGSAITHLNAVPTNGTLIRDSTGRVFVVAGGAPIYLSNWASIGGPQPTVGVDAWSVDNAGSNPSIHLNSMPTEGTFLRGVPGGKVYEIKGGAPIYISDWSQVGGPQPTTAVDQYTIDHAGGVPPFNHLNAPPSSKAAVTRVAGPTRIATATAVSQLAFPRPGSAGAVVLARSDDFPDALTGGPIAAKVDGPLLLTNPRALDPETHAELQRVLASGHTVYLLGGTSAVSDAVASTVQSLGYSVSRIAGANRFATAVAVAKAMGDPSAVFEATGLNYPDALTAVPAAVISRGAILLTAGATQAPETATYLSSNPPSLRWAIGGAATTADPGARSLAGADRWATAVAIDRQFFSSPVTLGVASGMSFADALAAGPYLGTIRAPLTLVPADGPPPGTVSEYAKAVAGSVKTVDVFGGVDALSDYTMSLIAGLL